MAASTTRGQFPYPTGGDNWKQIRLAIQAVADQAASVAALYSQGVASARPVASAAQIGKFYASTDTGAVDYCTGTAWVALVQAAGSTNADTLDGIDSTGFLLVNGKAADANLLDGVDSVSFARRDQANNFAGTLNVTSGQLQEAGQRVYSPGNPPPPSGAVIVQTIRGTVSTSGGVGVTDVTIPAVNPAKTQVRNLGGTFIGASGSSYGPGRIELLNSTTLRMTASTTASQFTISYELTEWSS